MQQFYGLKKASVVMLFKTYSVEGASEVTRPNQQVFITIPNSVYSGVKSWLRSGSRVVLRGHMAAERKEGGPVYDFTHLVADSIELFLPAGISAPAGGLDANHLGSVSIADLRHTLECLRRTLEALTGPADTTTRMDTLEAVASVCVIAKGHKFSAEQRHAYTEILALMRHNGKEDGNPRRMDDAEMSRCGELWTTLLAMAAMRIGEQQNVLSQQ